MIRARAIGAVGIFVALLMGCGNESANNDASDQVLTGESMGTTYRIKLAAGTDADAAQIATKQTLAELEQLLSTWRDDSWVSRFNRNRSTEPVPVPDLIWTLLEESIALCAETDGRFDITVGPLVERWGFGAHPSSLPPPNEVEIQELLEHVGYEKLKLDKESRCLKKLHPAIELDFGAIAKGYAVDRIIAELEKLGHQRYLVEFGGDLRGRSGSPGAPAWRIAQPKNRDPILLSDGALATSGPEYQHRGNVCHLIDPRSGRAIVLHNSVTASEATCTRADALATAKAIEAARE